MKIWKTIAISAAIALLAAGCARKTDGIKPTKNLIVMITDGTSTSLLSVARWYKRYAADSMELSLNMDPYVCALVRTNGSDAPITDSAPAMSAYMTGVRSSSGNLSIYPNPSEQDIYTQDSTMAWRPAATVMEAARLWQGKASGVVVTVPFCHATPAATSAHAASRSFPRLALQMASQNPDVVFGSGAAQLTDEVRSLIKASGADILVDDAAGFRAYEGDKLWALFNQDIMDFEIDRDPADEPSLAEMTSKAIDILSRNKKGFFLMVEGSKVDYGAHSNDVCETVWDFLAFDEAVKTAVDFAKKDGNTTVVILPDHGNSGITIADKNLEKYSRAPLGTVMSGISGIKASSYKLAPLLQKCGKDEIAPTFKQWTGIEPTADEIAALKQYVGVNEDDYMEVSNNWNLQRVIVDICNSRMHVGFTSGNHTGEDVFLAVYNPKGQKPEGVVANVDVNRYLCEILGLCKPLRALTDEIFAPYTEVFDADSCKLDPKRAKPFLTVSSGDVTLRIPAWKNLVYVQKGERIDSVYTRVPSVYMRQNQTFYLDRSLKELLR